MNEIELAETVEYLETQVEKQNQIIKGLLMILENHPAFLEQKDEISKLWLGV
jgi:hypothetical protein